MDEYLENVMETHAHIYMCVCVCVAHLGYYMLNSRVVLGRVSMQAKLIYYTSIRCTSQTS